MSKQKPIEFITPPNVLKAKLGGALPQLDERAIARAEAALAKLADNFGDWVKEETERLFKEWAAYEAANGALPQRKALYRCAHDLKGLAPTYGYPLAGRVSASMCKLIGDEHPDIQFPMSLLRAHIDAIRAIVHGKIQTADHPVGLALAGELELKVREAVAKAA
jgi:hypothetical protein